MDFLTILAQTAERTTEATTNGTTGAQGEEVVRTIPIDLIWQQIISLNLVEAMMFTSFGVVCLLYGWRVFRILITICFSLIGAYIGIKLNDFVVGGNGLWLALICLVVFACISIPLMRVGVTVLGAAAGTLITGGIWYAVGLPEQYIWAGGLIGLVAGGMISFIVFKIAIMLFTSLEGSALIVIAVIAVLYKCTSAQLQIEDLVYNKRWFLPVAIMIPTLVGILLQSKFIKGSKDWEI